MQQAQREQEQYQLQQDQQQAQKDQQAAAASGTGSGSSSGSERGGGAGLLASLQSLSPGKQSRGALAKFGGRKTLRGMGGLANLGECSASCMSA